MAEPKTSKHQKYKIQSIHRSQLVNAPYNPRVMEDAAKKRLKGVIKRIGLVEPVVWNERTGHIVGGHQRIGVLDSLEKSDDYYLDVACVDLDEKSEVEANIALNNTAIQGEYDTELLSTLKGEYELDFKCMGFTDADIDFLFEGELAQLLEDNDEVKGAKNKLAEIKEARKKVNFDEHQTGEFYFVVVCENDQEKEQLLKSIKVPKFEMYVDGSKIRNAIKGESE